MAFRKALMRSELKDPVKMTGILKKIKDIYAKGHKTVLVIEKGSAQYHSAKLVSLVIDETLSVGTIVFDDGAGAQTYDKADITSIQRIRSRRWKITINASANPA